MPDQILLSIASLYIVFHAIRIKKMIPALIGFGMIASFILVNFYLNAGFYLYIFFLLIASAWGILSWKEKGFYAILIIVPPLFMATFWFWTLQHWHGNTIIAPALTLVFCIPIIIKWKTFRNAWGYLIFIGLDALSIILATII